MAGLRYLRLFSGSKECPLGFIDRAVYSFLSWRRGCKPGAVSRTLGFDRRTAVTSIGRLAAMGLVHERDNLWYGNKPPDAALRWWYYPPGLQKLPQWHQRLAYNKVLLPEPGAGINIRESA